MPRREDKCKTCGRATNHAYLCRRCASELHDLLVGSNEPDGQPGIAWYVKRLRESAYKQTRLGRGTEVKASRGYDLLGDMRATDLLDRINGALAQWEDTVVALRSKHRGENAWVHTGHPTKESERLELRRARFIAANVVLLRHHHPKVHLLQRDMLDMARSAWRIINRPDDVCCGPCPGEIEGDDGKPEECSTLLYAEEGARDVKCQKCRATWNVEELRDALKAHVTDMLFTRADLVNLMATRLNDRIPQPTFTKLLRDGRLQPRHMSYDELGRAVPMFTYNDVCEARLKPVPIKRTRKVSA